MNIAMFGYCRMGFDNLCWAVGKFYEEFDEPVRFSCYQHLDKLIADIGRIEFDLIFLDVEGLKEKLVKISERIWCAGFGGILIIADRNISTALTGYAASASGFLLKPISFQKVRELLEPLNKRAFLTVRSTEGMINLKLNGVAYIESRNNCCDVHLTSGESYIINRRISELEHLLDRRFLRCHRSYIVNMDHVVGMDTDFILETGERVLVRKKGRADIRTTYNVYFERLKKF